MRPIFLAGAAAMTMIAAPVAAQVGGVGPDATTASVADKRGAEMTDEQRTMYESWPAEQRSAFDAWEPDRQVMYFGWTDALRGYYWQLAPERQEAWWYLDDEQRISLFQLGEEQREVAWSSIMDQVRQINGDQQASTSASAGSHASASTHGAATSQGNIRYEHKEMAQSTPAAQRPAEYPVCGGKVQDGCINPWAAGRRGPGVTRPLGHWPGEPASS